MCSTDGIFNVLVRVGSCFIELVDLHWSIIVLEERKSCFGIKYVTEVFDDCFSAIRLSLRGPRDVCQVCFEKHPVFSSI